MANDGLNEPYGHVQHESEKRKENNMFAASYASTSTIMDVIFGPARDTILKEQFTVESSIVIEM